MAIREDYRKLFEKQGLTNVRASIATGAYGSVKERNAIAWVEEQEQRLEQKAEKRKDAAVL